MLADAIAAALPELRREAEAMMLDTFTAYAFTTVKIDGLDEQSWVEQGATPGKVSGRARDSDTNTRVIEIGGVDRPVIEGGLHIPLSAPVPSIGWEYVLTALGPHTDPALLLRRWRVVDVPAKSYATARRIDVVALPEVTP